MNMILAVDNNWGIGKDNDLLIRVPGDMKYFREKTINKIVVMGYNTLISLPNSKPLKNRVNIIISRKYYLDIEGAIICHSIVDVFREISKYPPDDIFIIGGSKIYNQFEPYSLKAYVTKFNISRQADCFAPNLDILNNWKIDEVSESKFEHDLEYNHIVYKNHNIVIL